MKGKSLSRVRLLVTPWTAAHQAPLSTGFSRQEDWSGVPLPSPLGVTGYMQTPGRIPCLPKLCCPHGRFLEGCVGYDQVLV